MSTLPPPALGANIAHLQSLLLEAGHSLNVFGKYWNIDGKLAFWPDTGRYKFNRAHGGKGGTLRGGAESIFEHLHGMLIAA